MIEMLKQRFLYDLIVLGIINVILGFIWVEIFGSYPKLFSLGFWSIFFLAIGLSYLVDKIFKK